MAQVQVKVTHIVKPAEKTWTGTMPLTTIDTRHLVLFLPLLYLYRPNKEWSATTIVDTLKASLAKVLVHFYPFAGRPKPAEGGKVVLECEEAAMWVSLVEAEETTGIHVADLAGEEVGVLLTEDLDGLIPVVDQSKPRHEVPLMAVQVTHFQCGGLSLGLRLSHGVADGVAMGHFLTEWCRLARGEPLKEAPVNDRTLFGAREPPRSTPFAIQDLDRQPSQPPPTSNEKEPLPTLVPPTTEKTALKLVVSHSQIDMLKKAAGDEIVGHRPFTRFEVLAAHTWRCLNKTRAGHEGRKANVLGITMDVRKRTNPPLPKAYFGNAIVTIPVDTSSVTSSSLGQICCKIRQAIDGTTEEYIRMYLDKLESQVQPGMALGPAMTPKSGEFVKPDFVIVSWLTLSIYGLDFGWGKEMAIGCGGAHRVGGPGMSKLLLGPEAGSAILIITMELSGADTFKNYFYGDLM